MSDNSDSRFFPTHPMAGKASSGFDFSTADLFQQAVWAVTKNNSLVNKVIADLGATPVLTTIEEHDQAIARYSHLIQIVASSIAANDYLNAPQAVQLSGPVYKDVTRVAASDADFWQAIFQANKDNILPPLNQLITVLQGVVTCLENGNYEKK